MPVGDATRARRFRGWARTAGVAVAAIGAIGAIGWLFDLPLLRRMHPAMASMKFNAALMLVALGVSLWRSARPAGAARDTASRILAAAACAIALISLAENLAGIDLRIDQLIVRDPDTGGTPGRMSPTTAGCALLAGLALIWLEARWSAWLSLASAIVVQVALLGYLFGVEQMYAVAPYSSIALHTALALYALAGGTLFARPERGAMQLLTSDLVGGVLARRLVPAAVGIPLAIGLLRLWGEVAGWYGPRFGLALYATASVIVLVGVVLRNAVLVESIDRDRRHTLERMQRSDARKAAILARSLDGVIALDAEARVLDLNRTAETMFGCQSADVAGRLIDSLLVARGAELTPEALIHGLVNEPGIWKRIDLTARRADGSEFDAEVSMVRVEVVGPMKYTAFVRDVTALKRAQQAQQHSNDRLRVLADFSRRFATDAESFHELLEDIAQVTADLIGDGCVVNLVSDDGLRLLNAAVSHRDNALERDCRALLAGMTISIATSTTPAAAVVRTGQMMRADIEPGELVARTEEAIRPIVERFRVHSFTVVPIRAAQRVLGTLSLLRNRPGATYSDEDVAMIQELAERAGLVIEHGRMIHQLEQRVRERTSELETVNAELEAFSYSVAHDLRTPLRAIAGFSQALAEDHAEQLDRDGLRYLHNVRDAARRMGGLIDDLLNLSRIGRVELRRERVDVTSLTQAVVERLRATEPARVVEIKVAERMVAQADPRLTDIVLSNLIGNAWKFTSNRTRASIEIAAVTAGFGTAFVVRDNGAGFDAAYADKLFGVCQRLHGAQEFAGNGIGLAIVQRVVHHHGGKIWAEGKVGEGAAFYFTLDSAPAEAGFVDELTARRRANVAVQRGA